MPKLRPSTLRILVAAMAITSGSGCATYQPHEVEVPGGKNATALGSDDELYLRLLRLRKENEYKTLYDALARELDKRREKDIEGCIHAAGDLATISLERGWLDSATMALGALRECHARLDKGKVGDVFVSEDYVKLWGLPGESSPTIRCNTGHCQVRMLSNYFSWSRPLEDFRVKGEEGQRKGLAVVGAIIGTPFLIGPMTGYRNTRGAFRGTIRYERPRDPEKHMRDLIASLTESAQGVGFTPEARTFHERAANVFASVGNDARSVLRYRLRAALAYSDLNEATTLIARHAGTIEKIEALDYVGLVAQAPPSLDRTSAMHVVEPYYFNYVSGDPSEEAAARYLGLFPAGERSVEVRAIQVSLVEFRTKIAGKPRALVSFWNRHRDNALGKLAVKPLEALVKDNVKVLESHIYVTNGDGNWVNDAVEHLRPNGVYGGERFNVFVYGAFVNRSNVELPVRLTCNFHLWKTITVRALIVSSTETEPINKSSSFVAYLPPKKPKIFACLLRNQQSGGGISAGLLGGIDGTISFRDPPVYLEAAFEQRDISVGELRAQDAMLTALETKGNVETKVSPWEAERLAEAGSGGVMLHFHFSGQGRGLVPFHVTNEASQQVYGDTVVLNLSDFRTAVPPGGYTIILPKHRIVCPFRAEPDNTHVTVDLEKRTCRVGSLQGQKVAVTAPIPDATTARPVLVVNQPFSSNVDPPPRPPRTDLPDTLTLEDLKDGVRGPKEAALRRCRALARAGESVVLKMIISGPDGLIQDVVPVGESQNAELTQCVARELRSATFRKVQKLQIATQIRVAF